jgi:hypothetical protein
MSAEQDILQALGRVQLPGFLTAETRPALLCEANICVTPSTTAEQVLSLLLDHGKVKLTIRVERCARRGHQAN